MNINKKISTLIIFYISFFSINADYIYSPKISVKDFINSNSGDNSSCKKILESGNSFGNGIYTISVNNQNFKVYCDMSNGGWTLVARATSNAVNINDWISSGRSQNIGDYNNPNPNGALFKLKDDIINSIPSTVIKLKSDNYGTRYSASGNYCHDIANNCSGEYLGSYSDENLTTDFRKGLNGSFPTIRGGICDYVGSTSAGNVFFCSFSNTSSQRWNVGNGSSYTIHSSNSAAGFNMYVK